MAVTPGWPQSWARLGAPGFRVCKSKNEALAKGPCSASDGVERNRHISRIEQAIELRPGRAQLPGHCLFCFLLFLHGSFESPREHSLDSKSLDFFTNAFLLKKAVEC